MTDKLIILNLPHFRGLSRELANNPKQQKNSAYARRFQQEGAHEALTAEELAKWVTDPEAREKYVEAFRRSDFEAMLNYYKRNYPKEPYVEDTSPVVKVKPPVLMIHGLDDWALLPGALNGTWDWLEKDLTLVTIPGAGHFVQQDAADMVNRTMKMWLGSVEHQSAKERPRGSYRHPNAPHVKGGDHLHQSRDHAEIGRVPIFSGDEVNHAVNQARAAQPGWAALTFAERAGYILKARVTFCLIDRTRFAN